jgi:heme oxygenase
MLGFHAPVEELFARDEALAAAGFAARSRLKSHLLLADLRAVCPDRAAVPRCDSVPVRGSLPRMLGIAYVIEGSTLGGKYILAHLPPPLAALRPAATAFLAGYGEQTASQWKSFVAIAERELRTPTAEADAVAGARATFEHLIDWLAQFERRDERRARRAS